MILEEQLHLKLWFISSPFFFFLFFSNHNQPGAGPAACHRRPCSHIWGKKCYLEGHLFGSTGPIQWQLYHLECPQLLPEQPLRAGSQHWRRVLCLRWLSQPLPLLCQVIFMFARLFFSLCVYHQAGILTVLRFSLFFSCQQKAADSQGKRSKPKSVWNICGSYESIFSRHGYLYFLSTVVGEIIF